MFKKILIISFVLLLLGFGLVEVQRYLVGTHAEGLFKIGSCYKDDEFGVVYRVEGTMKGRTSALILESSKYPSQYKVGDKRAWSSSENRQKLYAVVCP